VLSDGTHSITATQTESGKTESVASSALQITVDTLPPSLAVPTDFKYLVAPQSLVYQFSENVQPALATANLDLQNTSNSTSVLPGQMSLGYVSNVGTITFTGLSNQILTDGNYTATLTGVTDVAGNPLATDVYNFFFLMGDANHDASVDTTDFNILAAHFSLSGNYGDADFNYDGTVDTTDFNLLASNFSATLLASRPAQASPLAAAAFSAAPILSSVDHQHDEGIEQII
jgi:Big-like domain-containing protein/dockerin type I repeat protein